MSLHCLFQPMGFVQLLATEHLSQIPAEPKTPLLPPCPLRLQPLPWTTVPHHGPGGWSWQLPERPSCLGLLSPRGPDPGAGAGQGEATGAPNLDLALWVSCSPWDLPGREWSGNQRPESGCWWMGTGCPHGWGVLGCRVPMVSSSQVELWGLDEGASAMAGLVVLPLLSQLEEACTLGPSEVWPPQGFACRTSVARVSRQTPKHTGVEVGLRHSLWSPLLSPVPLLLCPALSFLPSSQPTGPFLPSLLGLC